MKMTLWVSAILLFAASLCGLANAEDKKTLLLCPAIVTGIAPVHQLTNDQHSLGTDTAFGYYLYGDVPATVSGVLTIYENGSSYRTTFSHVVLKPHPVEAFKGGTPYRSDRLHFAFDRPHSVLVAWVSAAALDGATSRNCAPVPDGATAREPGRHAIPDDANFDAITATPAVADSKIDVGSCTVPFKNSELTEGTPPYYPNDLKSLQLQQFAVLARVILNDQGKVIEVYPISGDYKSAQDATVWAALRSKFRPPELLCVPIPGLYTFRATYDPSR